MHRPIRVTPSFLASVSIAAPLAVGQQYVEERVPTGSAPFTASFASLGHGDIDGDGWQDMVVRDSGNVDYIVRGGASGFSVTHLVGSNDSFSPGVADLNGDGRADLLSRMFVDFGYYPGQVGATLGSFVSIQSMTGNDVHWMKRAADVDGDGDQDVVVSVSTDAFGQVGALRWFAGNGIGGFSLVQSVAATPNPIRYTLGDFDADGFIDAAATGPTGQPAILFDGSGAGFAAPQPLGPASINAYLFAAGDFDADGIDDLVCSASSASTALAWFRGGVGGLTLGGSQVLPGTTGGSSDLRVADLEGDGDADVLLADGFGGSGTVWRSLGSPASGLGVASAFVSRPCSAVDAFEYDGQPGLDLVYTEVSAVWPTLRPGNGAGGLIANTDLSASGSCLDTDSVCAGDLDRDGVLDVAFESGLWFRGVGDGTFHPASPLGTRASELLDLDGDGDLDAVSMLGACGAQNGLNVALQTPTGFGPLIKPSQPATSSISRFTFGDLDADGDLDLVSAGLGGVYSHGNNGAGSFAPFITTTLPGPCSGIAAGDLNGDGFDDLARVGYTTDPFVGSVLEATMKWGISTGSGNVTGVQSKLLFQYPTGQARIDDLNGDGFADFAWASPAFGQIPMYLGNGVGGFPNPPVYATLSGSAQLLTFAIADVDGDGARDLIGGSSAIGHVGIARKNGATYALWRDVATGPVGASKILPYDFDADGQIDLAWGANGSLRVALNRRADASGTAPFGTGTAGCLGRASLGATQSAKVGNGTFRVLANHLPPSATGWFLISTGSSAGGIDPFGVGALLHVNPLPPNTFILLPTASDPSGQASLGLAIPPNPLLTGYSVAIQTAHYGVGSPGFDCSTSPYSLVTSRGLALTIQP
jgi:FG-GAP-like repeat